MSVNFYDTALLNKFKKWVAGTQVQITGPEETRRKFQIQLDNNNDNPITLPLITISRLPSVIVNSTNKKPLTYDGWRKDNNGESGSQLNGIPITIEYQLDIYTRYLEEADEYLREFIFNIINYPKLKIEIPYNNAKIEHVSNIRLNGTVQDNSDIPERLIPGQFTRFTIPLNIDDAYLFDYKIKENAKIVVNSVDIELQKDVNKEN